MKALMERISALLENQERVLVVIDGPCASGKTTLAGAISDFFDCNVIHMDDFFLRPEQRTPERLSEPGGNFDRERFREEVMNPLIRFEEFSYRPYLCSKGKLGDPIFVPRKKLYVIEGSYSHHPFIGNLSFGLKVFLTVSPEEQKRRLAARDPDKLERFLSEWIPMEEAYFQKFRIKECAHLCVNSEADS